MSPAHQVSLALAAPLRPAASPSPALPWRLLATCRWYVHPPALGQGLVGGIDGQLTALEVDGLVIFIRENLTGLSDFTTSSAARGGMKEGKAPSGSREVLDLCAPSERWDEIAALVAHLDARERPVRRHARFSVAWALERFREAGVALPPGLRRAA